MSGIADQYGQTPKVSGQELLITDLKELNLRDATIPFFVVSFIKQNRP